MAVEELYIQIANDEIFPPQFTLTFKCYQLTFKLNM